MAGTLGTLAVAITGNLSGLEKTFSEVEKRATGFGNKMEAAGKKISNVGKGMTSVGNSLTKYITAPVLGATTAAAGLVATLGWKRLVAIDSAKAQLEGFGYSLKDVERISKQVNDAVTGTTMTMAEGTSVAAGALAAGVKEGEELVDYIKRVGNAAVGSNREVDEMAMIFNRVQGGGRLMTRELNMIEQGMPGFSMAMAEHLGVSLEEFRKMVSGSQVSAEEFMVVMDGFAGDMADAYAGTWEGMVKNTKANIGIIGENLLGGVFEQSKESITEFLTLLRSDEAREWAKEMGGKIAETFGKIIQWVKDAVKWWNNLDDSTKSLIKKIAIAAVAAGPILTYTGKITTGIGGIVKVAGGAIKLFGKIGPLVGGLTGIFGGAAGAAGGLGASLAAIAGPAAIVIGVIAAITTGVVLLVRHLRKEVIPEVDLFADHMEYSVDSVTGEVTRMKTSISEGTKEAVGAFMELDKGARTSLHGLWLNSTEITKDIAKDMSGKYKEMTTQTLAALDERKKEELARLEEMFKDSSVLTEKEEERAYKKAEEHWDDKRGQVKAWQDRIEEIWQKAADARRGITQGEHDEILRLQEQIKEESIRLMSENEVEAKVILERMKEYDTRVTAEMMSEHIKTLNQGRDEAVAAAEDEYEQRLAAIIRMRDETGAISAGQADKMIGEAQRTRDETIEKAEELRIGALDKMRHLSEDLDEQVDTSTGEILTWWDKLKRWWSGWQPETKKFTVSEQRSGSFGGHVPQYAAGTDYHRGGLAIVGERGPELLNLPRGTQVKPLGAQAVKHSGTIRVEGVNDKGQLVGVVDAVIERLIAEVRA